MSKITPSNDLDLTNSSSSSKVKLLDPKLDAIFQILFSKTNPQVITGLLSAILDMPITKLENKTINLDLNKILDRTYPNDKIGILDVRAQVNSELEIDLEMQMLNADALLDRILWYWAKLYSNQLQNSDDYSSLKKTLEILIINSEIPSLKKLCKPCTKWQIRESEIFSEVLTDKFEIVIIELPKVEKAYQKNKNNALLQWMMFLLNPESLEVSKIMEQNKDIKIASNELTKISEEEINKKIAELREKARRDDVALLNTGKRIGKEEGLKQGSENGQKLAKEKIAQKLLALNIPIEQISEATELSLEQIKKLSNS